METHEVAKLLTILAADDGRKIDDDVIGQWYGVLANVPYKVGIEALRAASKNITIDHVEVHHVLGHAETIMARRNLEGNSGDVGAPGPTNWLEISDAIWADDPHEWMRQVAIYHEQCRQDGYDDEFMRRGVSITDYEHARRRLGL